MSQRLAMVILVTGAVTATGCSDGDHQGTLVGNMPKDDAGSSHTGRDAASEDMDDDDDQDEQESDAGMDDLDASDSHDASNESDAAENEEDASEPESDAGDDASVEPVTLPLSAAGQVIITEIMAAPLTATGEDDDGEWVEIYNPSANVTYELEGCTFSDKVGDADYAFADITIAPHSYLALSSVTFTQSVQGFVSDVVYGTKSGLSGSGDSPVITCSAVIIDTVNYAAENFPKPEASEGHAIQLSKNALDGTSNDTGSNWCFATKSYGTVTTGDGEATNYGTPKAENDACP
jgi:hypothetical protein